VTCYDSASCWPMGFGSPAAPSIVKTSTFLRRIFDDVVYDTYLILNHQLFTCMRAITTDKNG
jgi:deoxyxylulose-5-phosphate synthase